MTESPVAHVRNPRGEPPLDVEVALQRAAVRLTEEFSDQVTQETVSTMVRSAYDHIASQAKVETFLPLLAERNTRDRLRKSGVE